MNSVFYSLMPDVVMSLGVSSLISGFGATYSATNPYITDKESNLLTTLGLSSSMVGALVTNPGIEYVRDLNQTKAYIQSLSKEELQNLSETLTLMNIEDQDDMIEYLQDLNLGEFDDTYTQIERTKKKSIWG